MDSLESKISKREDVSPKEGENKYGKGEKFADETNKKYPLTKGGELSEERIRAAWNYISHKDNAAKYDDSEVETIKRKIIAAWKKHIDKEGPPSAKMESKMEEAKKDDEKEKEAKENPEEEKKETPEEEKKEEAKASFQAEIDKLTAALAETKKVLEATQQALEAERIARVSVESRYTARVLASLLEGDELKTAVEKAKGMTLDQIDLMASVSVKQKPAKSGLNFLDLSGGANQPERIKLTL